LTKEERAEQSRLRAAEHQRRKRTRMLLFIGGIVLYVLIPLLWNGAVEFGWIHPIRTPEFRSSVQLAGLVGLALIISNLDILRPKDDSKKEDKKDAGTQVPAQPSNPV
jgi:hypothetical protein